MFIDQETYHISYDEPTVKVGAIVFIGLSLIYLTEAPTRFGVFHTGARLVGLWQFLTGIWLMYLTYAVTLDTVFKAKLWA